MKTFRQFNEEFYKGSQGRFDYVEVFKNPTKSEMKEVSPRSGHELGAIVSGKNLYVWDRDKAEHADVRSIIPRVGSTWLPLYLVWDHATNVIRISVSSYSMQKTGRDSWDDDKIIKLCRELPAFKIFSAVKSRNSWSDEY